MVYVLIVVEYCRNVAYYYSNLIMNQTVMVNKISRNLTVLGVLTMADSNFRGSHRFDLKTNFILIVMSQMSQSTNYMRVFHMSGISCLKLEQRKTWSYYALCHLCDMYRKRNWFLFKLLQQNSCFTGHVITTPGAPFTIMGYLGYGLVTVPFIKFRVSLLLGPKTTTV